MTSALANYCHPVRIGTMTQATFSRPRRRPQHERFRSGRAVGHRPGHELDAAVVSISSQIDRDEPVIAIALVDHSIEVSPSIAATRC